jgi:hypothetical protein
MALPPSQTRVCNGTLARLGESRRIASINDPSPLAKTLLSVWDEAVDEVLVAHPWNPAVRRENLPVSADYVPAAGAQYAQAFELPPDCLRWLPWRRNHELYFEGEEENGFILSNADAPLPVRFIFRLTDLTKWKPGMIASLEALLAFKTARTITGSTTVMRDKQSEYEDTLSEAKRQDGAATGERARTAQFQSNWLDARNRPSSGIRYR